MPSTHSERPGTLPPPSSHGNGYGIVTAVVAVAKCLAREHGFSKLSPEAQRWAWRAAVWTHAPVFAATWWTIHLAPALHFTLRDVVLLHFLFALVVAKLGEVASIGAEIGRLPPPRCVTSGWLFAFWVTVLALLPFFLLLALLG